jgi:hypothetical protein
MYIWVDPGWLEKALVVSALPASLLGAVFGRGLAQLGVSELVSFMSTMPALIFGWFYLVGWYLDRWQHKRSSHRRHQPVRRCRNVAMTLIIGQNM